MPSAASHKIEDYEPLLVALQNVLGVVVPDGQRIQLLEKIEPLLTTYKLNSLASLAESLASSQADEIRSSVLNIISQRYADWSLCVETKNVLHNYIFAQLPDNARIWIVGCGQGQLAYAVAMEMAEYEKNSGETKKRQLFASDVPLSDIKQAELASYSELQLAELDDEYKKSYFSQNDDAWQIKDKLRKRISFSQCDLTKDFQSLEHMDLIYCPEALVYFSNGVKANILKQFSALLKPGGIFLTGNNQAVIPFTKGFERVEHPAGVFYRQKN
jgi:chemotaxis protein methyltransferase CheR